MANQKDAALKELIHRFALKAREKTQADRSSLWILDHKSHEMWTVIPSLEQTFLEIRIGPGQGYLGQVADVGETLNIPFDLYNDTNSTLIKKADQKNGYRTCSALLVPIFRDNQVLMGIMQLLNKHRNSELPGYNPANWPQAPECFKASFDTKDEEYVMKLSSEIRSSLQD